MPIYGYRCRECGETRDSLSNTDVRSCECGGTSRRDYTTVQLRVVSAFQPHFNHSVGQYVQTESEFRDALKRGAEANSLATGLDHKYEMVTPDELRTMEPTSGTDVIETSARDRARVAEGLAPLTPQPDPHGNIPATIGA